MVEAWFTLSPAESSAVRALIRSSAIPIVQRQKRALQGTGSVIEIASEHFLVTARHVLVGAHGLAIAPDRDTVIPLTGTGAIVHHVPPVDADCAVIHVSSDVAQIIRASRRILSIDSLHDFTPEPDSTLLMAGYPGAVNPQGLDPAMLFKVTVREKPSEPFVHKESGTIIDPNDDFHLFMSEESVWEEDEASTPIPRLEGISGCPVWAPTGQPAEGIWQPERIFGIVAIETGYLGRKWIRGTHWGAVARLIRRGAVTGGFGMKLPHVLAAIDAEYGVPEDAEEDERPAG